MGARINRSRYIIVFGNSCNGRLELQTPSYGTRNQTKNGINIINNSDDRQCFKWQTTRAVFPPKEKPRQRINIVNEKLREQAEKLDWTGISFPTPFSEIDVFENLNKISVMVLGWDDNGKEVIYFRLSGVRHGRAVQLFHYDNHYSTVRNMSALMRTENANHFCPYVLHVSS